jgi:hypothetical protein
MVRQRKGVGRWYVVVSSYDLDKMILHICPDGFKKDLLAWCPAVLPHSNSNFGAMQRSFPDDFRPGCFSPQTEFSQKRVFL